MAFVEAGALSLLVGAMAPALRRAASSPEDAEFRVQRVIHGFTRSYLAGLDRTGALRVRCTDAVRLRRPGSLIVANHPSLLDAWALMSQMPQADCVVKERYYENFFLGGSARAAGFIPSRDGASLVDECSRRLQRGRSLIIFPEGTRSPKGELGPFARGAAHIAMRSGCDPIPVTIRCDPVTLYRGQSWWDVPDRKPTLTLTVGDPIHVKDVVATGVSRGRAARMLNDHFRAYFERQLGCV